MKITDSSKGIVRFSSPWSFSETIKQVEAMLAAKRIHLFDAIDQAAIAASVGQKLRPTTILIFGDPAKGTPLMEAYPTLAIDLPLKVLIWEAGQSEVYISLTTPEFLQKRHNLPNPPFSEVVHLFEALVSTEKPPVNK